MNKFLLLCFSSFIVNFTFAQITGNVTSDNGETLPFVSVYLNNTYVGTTTNEEGNYTLDLEKTGDYTIVFQYLGFKTLKKKVSIVAFPYVLDAKLVEENISLSEVVINSEENPANQIIRNTIAKRKQVLEKLSEYKANFYSRGLIKIKDAPKKVFGQEVGDLGGGLDSTRTGIIYLSETISKIEYKKPRRLKEKILASKVSGDATGFSFNNATDVNYNFYNNTFDLGNTVISPIADYAFNYYKYKLEGIFYDDNNNLINKILITPKRDNDAAFSGYIYIVEDQWLIYATDVTISGMRTGIAPVDLLALKQTFSFSETATPFLSPNENKTQASRSGTASATHCPSSNPTCFSPRTVSTARTRRNPRGARTPSGTSPVRCFRRSSAPGFGTPPRSWRTRRTRVPWARSCASARSIRTPSPWSWPRRAKDACANSSSGPSPTTACTDAHRRWSSSARPPRRRRRETEKTRRQKRKTRETPPKPKRKTRRTTRSASARSNVRPATRERARRCSSETDRTRGEERRTEERKDTASNETRAKRI